MTEYKEEPWKNPIWDAQRSPSKTLTAEISGERSIGAITEELADFVLESIVKEYPNCSRSLKCDLDRKQAAILLRGSRIKPVHMSSFYYTDDCEESRLELYALKQEGNIVTARLIEREYPHEVINIDRDMWSPFFGGKDCISDGVHRIVLISLSDGKLVYNLKKRHFQPTCLDFFHACPDYKKPLIHETEIKIHEF